MLDRNITPRSHPIKAPKLTSPEAFKKENATVHVLKDKHCPLVRLHILLEAGGKYETIPGAAYFTSKMLTMGSIDYNASAISQLFEQEGADLNITHTPDNIFIQLTALKKSYARLVKLLVDILLTATFPNDELGKIKQIATQELKVKKEKSSYIASGELKSSVFGTYHPYGYRLTEEAIQLINQDVLCDFYQQQLFIGMEALLGGAVDMEIIQTTLEVLNKLPIKISDPWTPQKLPQKQDKNIKTNKNAKQASIAIGKVLPNKLNPNYWPIVFTNGLLGGYFGSRLMKNIREQKGYTYGISSHIFSFKEHSLFCIQAEVILKYVEQTLFEIEKEIKILQEKPIPKEELLLFQNYWIGTFCAENNDVFSQLYQLQSVRLYGLTLAYFNQMHKALNGLSTQQIMQTTQEYFQLDSLAKIIVS